MISVLTNISTPIMMTTKKLPMVQYSREASALMFTTFSRRCNPIILTSRGREMIPICIPEKSSPKILIIAADPIPYSVMPKYKISAIDAAKKGNCSLIPKRDGITIENIRAVQKRRINTKMRIIRVG
jgi:hypothetical protein